MSRRLTNGPRGILPAAHEDVSVPAAAIVWTEAHIGTQDCSSLSKQVLEILPTHTIWELEWLAVHCAGAAARSTAQSTTHVANKEVYTPI